jgi:hypothetical protein
MSVMIANITLQEAHLPFGVWMRDRHVSNEWKRAKVAFTLALYVDDVGIGFFPFPP